MRIPQKPCHLGYAKCRSCAQGAVRSITECQYNVAASTRKGKVKSIDFCTSKTSLCLACFYLPSAPPAPPQFHIPTDGEVDVDVDVPEQPIWGNWTVFAVAPKPVWGQSDNPIWQTEHTPQVFMCPFSRMKIKAPIFQS